MYHEVEDDGDIGTAWVEQCQAMHLNEERLANERFRRDKGRIETLHMPHLYFHACFIGQSFQGVGLIWCGHNGLFDEDMLAFLQHLGGAFKMTDGGCDDINDIHCIYQSINGFKTFHVHFGFHLPGSFISRVKKAYQFIFFYLFDAVEMDFAQMPCT